MSMVLTTMQTTNWRKVIMADDTGVRLSISGYNQIKADNYKMNLFIDNLFAYARLNKAHDDLVFDNDQIIAAVKFCYYERYKKKMATLKSQFGRYGNKYGAEIEEEENGTENISSEVQTEEV